MPAGVSWARYLTFTFAALGTMALGAQTVHMIYKPLQDFDQYVDRELEKTDLPMKAKDILDRWS